MRTKEQEEPYGIGGGKYEYLCDEVMKQSGAESAIVMVINGNKGHGFSVGSRAGPNFVKCLPDLLRTTANRIEQCLNNPSHEQSESKTE